MTWKKWFENWNMTSLSINAGFATMEWAPAEPDKDAAWELYIELLTRSTIQDLEEERGDEETALASIYSLFELTRDVIKAHGRDCFEFTKIAVIILNQKVRPFTTTWHKISLAGGFEDKALCFQFRQELQELQKVLSTYTQMLAEMAGVEDLTLISSK